MCLFICAESLNILLTLLGANEQQRRRLALKQWRTNIEWNRQQLWESRKREIVRAFGKWECFVAQRRKYLRWRRRRVGLLEGAVQYFLQRKFRQWRTGCKRRKIIRTCTASLRRTLAYRSKRRAFSAMKVVCVREEISRRKAAQAEIELASTRLENELAHYRTQNTEHEALQVPTMLVEPTYCFFFRN